MNYIIKHVYLELQIESDHESNLPPFFGDWSQSEKLSEIKLPLVTSRVKIMRKIAPNCCGLLKIYDL